MCTAHLLSCISRAVKSSAKAVPADVCRALVFINQREPLKAWVFCNQFDQYPIHTHVPVNLHTPRLVIRDGSM